MQRRSTKCQIPTESALNKLGQCLNTFIDKKNSNNKTNVFQYPRPFKDERKNDCNVTDRHL